MIQGLARALNPGKLMSQCRSRIVGKCRLLQAREDRGALGAVLQPRQLTRAASLRCAATKKGVSRCARVCMGVNRP